MVYKIQGDFESINFALMLNKIEKHFKILYVNYTLYIALISIEEENKVDALIKDIFKPAKKFFVNKITEKNILNEEETIMNWCRDNLVLLEREKFEKEKQTKLQEVWKAMDNMEEILHEKLSNTLK